MGRLSRPGLVTIAWAIVGLIGGHTLAYAALYPDRYVRADVLTRTGHDWLWLAGPAVIVALAVAIGAGMLGPQRGRGIGFTGLARIQVTAFIAVEFGERMAAGMAGTALVSEFFDRGLWLILLIGILVQLITARLGAAASAAVAAAAAAVWAGDQPPRPVSRPRILVVPPPRRPASLPSVIHGARAPPASIV
jgi:hypothetical protein